MPNVGDIIRAADFSGAGIKAGAVFPFYNVTLSGRYPIFWGESEADTGWLVCDGGSDLHGGNVPNLTNRFIMGTNTVSGANKTGGSTTTSSTSHAHTGTISGASVSATTLTTTTMPSHTHNIYYYVNNVQYQPHPCFREVQSNARSLLSSKQILSTGGSQSHTHTLTGTITLASSGAHTHTITPPYYTLIYLVKLP